MPELQQRIEELMLRQSQARDEIDKTLESRINERFAQYDLKERQLRAEVESALGSIGE